MLLFPDVTYLTLKEQDVFCVYSNVPLCVTSLLLLCFRYRMSTLPQAPTQAPLKSQGATLHSERKVRQSATVSQESLGSLDSQDRRYRLISSSAFQIYYILLIFYFIRVFLIFTFLYCTSGVSFLYMKSVIQVKSDWLIDWLFLLLLHCLAWWGHCCSLSMLHHIHHIQFNLLYCFTHPAPLNQ